MCVIMLNFIKIGRTIAEKWRFNGLFKWRPSAILDLLGTHVCLQCSDAVGPACKKTEQWGAGMVICPEQGADLHMAQLMPLPLTVSCFSKIQIGFTFLVPAHLGSPGQRAVKWVCVY